MHTFFYQLKLLVRNRSTLFWSMVFPLILATFFQMAFSKLTSHEGFQPAKVAIVYNQDHPDLKTFLDHLSQEGDEQLLDVQYVSLTKAQTLLTQDDIAGYIVVDDSIKLKIKDNGISQTIIKTVLDTYLQTQSSFHTIASSHPEAFQELMQTQLNMNQNYLHSQNISSVDITVIYFYTLIGMTCMYGGFWGLKISNLAEANLSRQGTRLNIAPTSKLTFIFTGTIAAFLCQFLAMLLLFAYLVFGLHVNFGHQTFYILTLMAIGSYVGITLGNLIGHLLKCKENTKISILSSVSLLCSFLSGMMIVDLKYFIQEYAPILAYLNPVHLITDALYALYYYPTYERFFTNIIILITMGIVFTVISIVVSRRKTYDYL